MPHLLGDFNPPDENQPSGTDRTLFSFQPLYILQVICNIMILQSDSHYISHVTYHGIRAKEMPIIKVGFLTDDMHSVLSCWYLTELTFASCGTAQHIK